MARLSEQFSGIPERVISKLFKLLNEEKKKNRTRASLLEAIKKFAPFLGIPNGFELYILELYALNFRKDGDYSNLTKENFVDPRKQSGKVVSNPKAKLYTIAQLPFRGSNMEGYWTEDPKGVPYYKVTSYGWYPIYIFKDDKWYEVTQNYSSSTARQKSNANPVSWGDDTFDSVYTLTSAEMKMLENGYSHEDVMKNKVQKLKSLQPELSKRKKTAKTYGYRGANPDNYVPNTNIKFQVKNIDVEDDKAIVDIDVYDVVNREGGRQVDTPQNYLKGEIPNLTPAKVEDAIRIKMRGELRDYIGKRFRWVADDPKGAKIEFRFNHLKQPGKQEEMKEGELTEKCWSGYTQKGMKTMFGKRYPNCVKKTK